MDRIKRSILALALVAICAALAACHPIVGDMPSVQRCYATFFPFYAITQALTRGVPGTSVYCLVQPQDGCWRAYAVSDWDLYTLAYDADIVISGGRGLESFSTELQAQAETEYILIESLYGLELLGEDTRSGEYESHFDGPNPHLYMTPEGTIAIAETIAASLEMIDEADTALYQSNLDAAVTELRALIDESDDCRKACAGVLSAVMNEALIYTADECGFDVKTVIRRENGEDLAPEALNKHIESMRLKGIRYVLMERQAPAALVSALTDAGFDVILLDVMTTQVGDEDAWKRYLDTMRTNYQHIYEHVAQS